MITLPSYLCIAKEYKSNVLAKLIHERFLTNKNGIAKYVNWVVVRKLEQV